MLLAISTAQQPGKFPFRVSSCEKSRKYPILSSPVLSCAAASFTLAFNALLWLDVQAKRAAVNRRWLDLVEIETMTAK